MMWQAKLKAWAVGLGLTAATLGGTGYLATTGVGQGPPVPSAGPAPTKGEQPLTKGGERPEPFPPAKGDPDYAESLQFDIDRAKLQIQRADAGIKLEDAINTLQRGSISPFELKAMSIAGLQAKEDKLVAERNLKLAERKLAALKGQPVVPATAMTAELRKLREQYVEALTKAMKSHDGKRAGGLFQADEILSYMNDSQKLAEAEMSLAATNEQKIASWVKHRDRTKEARIATESRNRGGLVSEASLHEARAAELAAEIRLLELGGK